VIQKISDAFAKLKELEDSENKKEETFWKDLNDLKLPLYLIYEDGKLFKINLIMKFLNNSGKNQNKIPTKRRR
jgi:hypothetical protein